MVTVYNVFKNRPIYNSYPNIFIYFLYIYEPLSLHETTVQTVESTQEDAKLYNYCFV